MLGFFAFSQSFWAGFGLQNVCAIPQGWEGQMLLRVYLRKDQEVLKWLMLQSSAAVSVAARSCMN